MAARPAGAAAATGRAPWGTTGGAGASVRVPPSYPVHSPAYHWPLSSIFPFEAAEVAVPRARGHAGRMLREWGDGLASLATGTEAVVSELVTNAVEASKALPNAPAGRLALFSDRSRVLVLVGDHSHHEPVRAALDPGALRGRGLLLVEAYSTRWGWFPTQVHGFAKIVWSEIT
jgi:anti-sigma regulatory factor (Ser/Thr protein kinase)